MISVACIDTMLYRCYALRDDVIGLFGDVFSIFCMCFRIRIWYEIAVVPMMFGKKFSGEAFLYGNVIFG